MPIQYKQIFFINFKSSNFKFLLFTTKLYKGSSLALFNLYKEKVFPGQRPGFPLVPHNNASNLASGKSITEKFSVVFGFCGVNKR